MAPNSASVITKCVNLKLIPDHIIPVDAQIKAINEYFESGKLVLILTRTTHQTHIPLDKVCGKVVSIDYENNTAVYEAIGQHKYLYEVVDTIAPSFKMSPTELKLFSFYVFVD